MSSGEFIQFLDQDDILHPAKIEICVSAIMNNDSAVAISSFEHFRTSLELVEAMNSEPRDSYWMRAMSEDRSKAYFIPAFWGYLSPVFRRNLVACVGAFPDKWEISTAEEAEFHLRVKLCKPVITYVDKVLAFHRITKGSITHQTWRVTRECSIANYLMSKILIGHGIYDNREWGFLINRSLRLGWRAVRYTQDVKAFFSQPLFFWLRLEPG